MTTSQKKAITRIEPRRGWMPIDVRELWKFRDLFIILAGRSLKLRYKQTALGLTWVILQPLIPALIVAVVFGQMAKLPADGDNYLLFAYVGLLPWNIFAQMLRRGGNILVNEHNMLRKVYFPRMLLPLSTAVGVLLDFTIGLLFFFAMMAFFGEPLTWRALTLPLFVGVVLLLTTGVTLVVSSLNVFYRDVSHTIPFVTRTLMWASPVIYSTSLIPSQWHTIYALNPLVGIIDGFRWALLAQGDFPKSSLLLSIGVALVSFWLGALIFRRFEQQFSDVV